MEGHAATDLGGSMSSPSQWSSKGWTNSGGDDLIWRPFFNWLATSWISQESPRNCTCRQPPGCPEADAFWAGNLVEAGQVCTTTSLHGYRPRS